MCKSFCVSKLLTSRSRSTRRSRRRRSSSRSSRSSSSSSSSSSQGWEGVDSIQTRQRCAEREQRNKYKPRTETSTKQEQTEEQHLTTRHAGRPADSIILPVLIAFQKIHRGERSQLFGQVESPLRCRPSKTETLALCWRHRNIHRVTM